MKRQAETFLDNYLSSIGLWRKPVARDGLSLFRAVSEQLFMTQTFHTNLYEACRIVFLHLGMDPETDWTEIEVIQILSRMYRRDFLIYESVGHAPFKASNNNYNKKILLCRIGDNQLDSVYQISFKEDAAICQSIVYEMLYRNVFKLDTELTEAVALIRDQNKRKLTMYGNRFEELEDSCLKKFQDMHCSIRDRNLRRISPPVPYRIAKALDPCIYRNVELDIWEEEKREQIKESPEYRERFAPGDKCQVILEGEHYHGHIQEISAEDNTAVVFIHELGEKKSVLISCLKTPPSPRYSCLSHSKYLKRKQDMPISSTGSGSNTYENTTIKYPIYHQRLPVQQEVNYTSTAFQGYNFETTYTYQGDMMANANSPGYVGMDTSPVNNAKTNINNQMSPPGVLQRYAAPVPGMIPQGAVASPYIYNSLIPNSNQTYSCVCVPYLESIAVKDVNMNCLPSQDTTGKDLPEMNTLRFFYNLGVENYRLISHGGPMWPTVEMSQMMPPNGMVTQDQLNGNMCGQFALPPPIQYSSQNEHPTNEQTLQNGNRQNQTYHYHPYIPTTYPQGSPVSKRKSPSESPVTSPNKGQTVSAGDDSLDSNDSGCDSDSTSSAQCNGCKEMEDTSSAATTTVVELEQKLDNYIAKVDETDNTSCISSTTEFQVPSKPKPKRKYYMYGNLKLVKPIKDIPPKFLSMLNSLGAEKARCEGEPIIIPFLPPKPYRKYNKPQSIPEASGTVNSVESHGFNPEAKCFVPGDSVMQDPSIIACSNNQNAAVQYVPYGIYPASSKADSSLVYPHNVHNIYTNTPQSLAHANSGDGSQGNPNTLSNPSNTNYGDGSKYSMPTLSTGQACPTYPVSCPVYYAAPGSYNGAQAFLPPPNGVTGPGTYPQLCSMPPQVQAMQTA
ncbi:uncharacterized protein LOC132727724 isoform X2 [Ruditapes philippinarum]|nr:uncharacterized protein LOC132727724 isoform X2 [Ruditapes philippinarum]